MRTFLEIEIKPTNSHNIIHDFNPPENLIKFGVVQYSGHHVIGTDLYFARDDMFYIFKDNTSYNFKAENCLGKVLKHTNHPIEKFMPAMPWLLKLSTWPIKILK